MNVERLVVGPLEANCYVVTDGTGEGIVIDPGGQPETILAAIKRLKANIKYIILTHGHLDHAVGLPQVKASAGALVALHSDDIPLLNDRTLSAWLGMSLPRMPPPDIKLQDWQEIRAGELSLTVLHTPGHTPGGICLLGEGVLFSGDTLFQNSIGRADLPGGDQDTLTQNIQTRLMILPDDTIVYPGHGPPTTIGQERRYNPFLQGEDRPRLCPEHPGEPGPE